MPTAIPVQKILTHESPDLDAILSVLLLRQFGEAHFPGISQAEVIFASAGKLPDDMTPNQLERKGIIAVDIGGGRFDSHPSQTTGRAKRDRSAADLVAEYLGVLDHPDWALLIEYSRMQDTTGHSLFSMNQMHHLVSLHTFLLGLTLLHEKDSATKMDKGLQIVGSIPFYVKHKADPFPHLLLKECVKNFLDAKQLDPEALPPWLDLFGQWYQRFQEKPANAFAKNKMDKIVSLKAVALGTYFRTEGSTEKVQEVLNICLEAICEREKTWHNALAFYDEHVVLKKIHDLTFVSIGSNNGMVIKAARFRHRPDVLVYHNPDNGAVTIFVQRRGKLQDYPFQRIAARIRLAESVQEKKTPDYDQLESTGTHHGWFLHQSYIMLIRGSKKQTDFEPTLISPEHINLLIYSMFEPELEMQLPKAYAEAILKYRNPFFR